MVANNFVLTPLDHIHAIATLVIGLLQIDITVPVCI